MRSNLVANFAGKAWSAGTTIIFLPVYVSLLGPQIYGLLGIFASLTALFMVLDLGLSTTLSRELARLSTVPDSEQGSRDMVRSFEVIYWGVGLIIGSIIIGLAPLIAYHWVNTKGLPAGTVDHCIIMMGLIMAFQWPYSLYFGGLMGLQRQVLANSISIAMATVQYVGCVLILWLVSRTVYAFFVWQLCISAALTLITAYFLWASLAPSGKRPAFRIEVWRRNWQFAAGMSGIALLTTVLGQSDKVLLSRTLTLTAFGYYGIATMGASVLSYISVPVLGAVFPRFSQLVAENRHSDLVQLYHKSCQLVSALAIPTWVVLALFSKEVLSIWLRDPVAVRHVYPLLSLIATGIALNALVTIPYGLQLAYGWTRLTLCYNVISVLLLVPSLVFAIARYGAVGAAIVPVILNGSYVIILVPIMHRRILPREMWHWYFTDVAAPLLCCLGVGLTVHAFLPVRMSMPASMLVCSLTFCLALLVSALVLPVIRQNLILFAATGPKRIRRV